VARKFIRAEVRRAANSRDAANALRLVELVVCGRPAGVSGEEGPAHGQPRAGYLVQSSRRNGNAEDANYRGNVFVGHPFRRQPNEPRMLAGVMLCNCGAGDDDDTAATHRRR
jgi:hypothetical protein